MTDAILISIQPESAEKIPSGGKKFEFRGGIYNINSYSKNIYSLFPLFPLNYFIVSYAIYSAI